jgi:hypothetical protein
MEPKHFRYGGGAAESNVLPLTVVLLVVVGVLMMTSRRRYLPILFLCTSLLMPLGQVLVIGGLHLMVFRLLVLFGWARVIVMPNRADDVQRVPRNSVDRAILWWVVSSSIAFILLYGDVEAITNRLGTAYSVLGTYYLMRNWLRDSKDVELLLKCLGFTCVGLSMFMLIEQHTGRNWFSVFGGVSEITQVRDGAIRSQGPFAHAIIAGTFGATMLPLFITLWYAPKAKVYAICGVIGGSVMVFACHSATPLMAVGAGVVALLFWPLRGYLCWVRRAFVAMLVALHLVMKAPVWALIGRIDVVSGNSADHRYELVNRTILHFGDWWLFGAPDTEKWGYLMHDTANGFVDAAVSGGLVGLIFFIAILVKVFSRIGSARRAAASDLKLECRLWAWGTWLFTNVVAFFGIAYFDQSMVAWYSLLAAVSAVTVIGDRQTQQSIRLTPKPISISIWSPPPDLRGWTSPGDAGPERGAMLKPALGENQTWSAGFSLELPAYETSTA